MHPRRPCRQSPRGPNSRQVGRTLAIGGGAPPDHRESELSTLVRARSRSTVAAAACSPTRSVSIFHSSSSRPFAHHGPASSPRPGRRGSCAPSSSPHRPPLPAPCASAIADTWSRSTRCSASSSTRAGRHLGAPPADPRLSPHSTMYREDRELSSARPVLARVPSRCRCRRASTPSAHSGGASS